MDVLPGRRIVVALVALAAVGLLGGYGTAMRARPRPERIALATPAPHDAERAIYVHVGGAVARPGLFRLREGVRVDDAVRAAGGPTQGADLDGLNLAAKVRDGDKILVPKRAAPGTTGATAQGATDAQGDGSSLVNLNSATVAELETLPGIGPALAQRIVEFRTDGGGFRRIEDLLEVPGIGPKKFEALKDHVTV